MLNVPWEAIVSRYEESIGLNASIDEMLLLSRRIACSPLAEGLYSWTSMFDLCITQTPVTYPYDGPYLKISPLSDGHIEFRYVDTHQRGMQWHRTVGHRDAVPRLLSFLGQLRWFPPESLGA